MATFLISILAALGVVMIITVLGLILTQILINRADRAQTQTNILSEQSQGVFVHIDDLPETQQEPGIAIISNDIIKGTSHRHHHLTKKTVSVIDQDVQFNHVDTTTAYKSLTIPTKTNTSAISTSIVNPLTDKITLEY